MASHRYADTPFGSRGRRRFTSCVWRITLFLLLAMSGLMAQDSRWSYQPDTDPVTDPRDDAVWTDAIVPASPAYRFEVLCDDTEYVSVFVRSGSEIASATSCASGSMAAPKRYCL